ncbi:hypothetical protein X801_09305 [Opisthorchis viverrini]|uniref:Uncharacterized protein n=1 Tax=Opisthorchis viverrini TaxID=6198 RepID=A0A1S8WKD0_OPIVI|nr:hypothetical protein X801_09305 [Opisthorchis viverrini]
MLKGENPILGGRAPTGPCASTTTAHYKFSGDLLSLGRGTIWYPQNSVFSQFSPSSKEQTDIPDNSTYDAVGHVLQVFKNSRMVEQTAGIKEKANQIGAQAFRLMCVCVQSKRNNATLGQTRCRLPK